MHQLVGELVHVTMPFDRGDTFRVDALNERESVADHDFFADPAGDELGHQGVKTTTDLVAPPGQVGVMLGQQTQHGAMVLDPHLRPHRALGRRTPKDAYDARPKATPSRIPLNDAHYRVRHDTIDASGKLTLRHGSRLHHIGIGRRHHGQPVLILVKDLHVRVTTTDGQLLRQLTLDPTRNYQPQPKT